MRRISSSAIRVVKSALFRRSASFSTRKRSTDQTLGDDGDQRRVARLASLGALTRSDSGLALPPAGLAAELPVEISIVGGEAVLVQIVHGLAMMAQRRQRRGAQLSQALRVDRYQFDESSSTRAISSSGCKK